MSISQHIFVSLKVGDKITAPGKEHLGIKHLMPVDYIDPDDWGRSWEDIKGDWKAGWAFGYIRLNKALWKPIIQDAIAGIDRPDSPHLHRARKIVFNLAAIETYAKKHDLLSSWRAPYSVPIVNCDFLSPTDGIKLARSIQYSSLTREHDYNAVAAGTYTYGDGSKNYLTRAAAWADIANLTGNLTFVHEVSTSENATNQVTETLGGFTFKDHCPTNTQNPTTNIISTHGSATAAQFLMFSMSGGAVILDKLHIKANSAYGNYIININSCAANDTFQISNCLIDGQGGNATLGIGIGDADAIVNIFNNKIWDITQGTGYGIISNSCAAGSKIENNTIIGCDVGINATADTFAATNNLISCTTCWQNISTGVTGKNNASSDATGEDGDFKAGSSGNISNITIANEVQSTTDTDANFLTVRTDATNANDGGTAVGIAANTTGIEGNPRPATFGSEISIGASQWQGTTTTTTTTSTTSTSTTTTSTSTTSTSTTTTSTSTTSTSTTTTSTSTTSTSTTTTSTTSTTTTSTTSTTTTSTTSTTTTSTTSTTTTSTTSTTTTSTTSTTTTSTTSTTTTSTTSTTTTSTTSTTTTSTTSTTTTSTTSTTTTSTTSTTTTSTTSTTTTSTTSTTTTSTTSTTTTSTTSTTTTSTTSTTTTSTSTTSTTTTSTTSTTTTSTTSTTSTTTTSTSTTSTTTTSTSTTTTTTSTTSTTTTTTSTTTTTTTTTTTSTTTSSSTTSSTTTSSTTTTTTPEPAYTTVKSFIVYLTAGDVVTVDCWPLAPGSNVIAQESLLRIERLTQ